MSIPPASSERISADADRSLHVVHAIGMGPGGDSPGVLGMLADLASAGSGPRHSVLVIGSSRHARRARNAGLRVTGFLPATPRLASGGGRSLRRVLAQLSQRHGRFDVVHGWNPLLACAVRDAGAPRPCVATVAGSPPDAADGGFLQMQRGLRGFVVTWTNADRDRWVACGAAPGRTEVVCPGVRTASPDPARRADHRRCWEVPEQAVVVGMIGNGLDARFAAVAGTRIRLTGRDVRFVLSPSAHHRSEALHVELLHGGREQLIFDERVDAPRAVRDAYDVACHAGPVADGGAILDVLSLLAGGVPVIAPDLTAFLQHEQLSELECRPDHVNDVCACLCRLHDDRDRRARLAIAAREEIERHHPWCDFVAALEGLYRRLASTPSRAPVPG